MYLKKLSKSYLTRPIKSMLNRSCLKMKYFLTESIKYVGDSMSHVKKYFYSNLWVCSLVKYLIEFVKRCTYIISIPIFYYNLV